MQTTLELDEQLLKKAMEGSGDATEKDVVETALRLLVRMNAQAALRGLRGKVEWDGDLEKMRLSSFHDE